MRALSILFFLWISVGCESPCVLNSQCGTQELCREGSCLKKCVTYHVCGDNQACYQGVCQTPPPNFCNDLFNGRLGDAGPGSALFCEPPDRGMLTEDQDVDEGVEVTTRFDMDLGRNNTDMEMSVGGVEVTDMEMSVGGVEVNELGMGGVEVNELGMGGVEVNELGMGGDEVKEMGMGGAEMIDMMTRPTSLTPWLYTSGGVIYQTGQRQWIGRGVNIHDTRSCDACTWIQPNVSEVTRRIDEVTDVWGANLIRLNLESYPSANGRIQHRSILEDQAYLRDIERIVHHVGTKTGVYIMLSVWKDPSLSDDGWPTEQTQSLLRLLIQSFYDTPQVILGVSHSPRQNLDGSLDGPCWNAMNQAVEAIRSEERLYGTYRHLVAVQGTRDQGRDLSYYLENPITSGGGENILYETHIFNPQADFDRLLVSPAQSLPVLIGAFGPASTPQNQMTQRDALSLIIEAERQQVSWTAWTFHMRCQSSAMIIDSSQQGCGVNMPLQPTEWGQVVQNQLDLNRP